MERGDKSDTAGEFGNGTVQGAVATWRHRKSLPAKYQVATAPCTVPIRQRYHKPAKSAAAGAGSGATGMSEADSNMHGYIQI
jgi:hypothetical protein